MKNLVFLTLFFLLLACTSRNSSVSYSEKYRQFLMESSEKGWYNTIRVKAPSLDCLAVSMNGEVVFFSLNHTGDLVGGKLYSHDYMLEYEQILKSSCVDKVSSEELFKILKSSSLEEVFLTLN